MGCNKSVIISYGVRISGLSLCTHGLQFGIPPEFLGEFQDALNEVTEDEGVLAAAAERPDGVHVEQEARDGQGDRVGDGGERVDLKTQADIPCIIMEYREVRARMH